MTVTPNPQSFAASRPDLDCLFKPRGVAVAGALSDPSKHGARVFANLVNSGFPGDSYPITRSVPEVSGHATVGSFADVAGKVDLAFLMVPAAAVPETLEEAAAAGVKVCIIGASGFAESGFHDAQARQAEIAARTGMRIVGPNCNGMYNAHFPLSVGFNSAHGKRLKAGGVAVLSHSGALFDPLMRMLNGYGSGLSFFVSAGNEVDLSVIDYAEYAVEDPNTRVLALLLDALSDGARFARLARRADELGKSIVVLKLGSTEAGAEAAVAHSSRMTGSATAYAAFFKALGVPTVDSLEGFMCAAAMLDRYGRRDGGLCTITTSGAGGALVADLAGEAGIRLASYGDKTEADLASYRQFSTLGNPTDLGVFGTPKAWPAIMPALAADPDVGVVMAYIHSMGGKVSEAMWTTLGAARAATGKPVIVVPPGDFDPAEVAEYAAKDIPVVADSHAALQAVAAILTPRAGAGAMQSPVAAIEPLPERNLSEAESLELLGRFGLPVVAHRSAASVDEATAAAQALGWPVAVKALAADVAHKSDLGLVRLNVTDRAGIEAAAEAFGGRPMIVEPMIVGEVEAILGVSRAPGVGVVLMAGLGGIYAEAIGGACVWPLGVSRDAVAAKLDESVLGRILTSHRWRHPQAREQLIEALMALQAFAVAAGEQIEAVDINPLVLGSRGAVAVDALIVPRGAQAS